MMGHIGVKVWLYKGDVGEEITEENAPEVPERGRGRR
jgi:ribosomal protein S3